MLHRTKEIKMSYENVLYRLFDRRLSTNEFEKQLKIHFGESVALRGSPNSKNHDLFIPHIENDVVIGGDFYHAFDK